MRHAEADLLLEGLDTVNWVTLRHAYGNADDVPDLLRALASSDEMRRVEAINALFGNVWHQGTVYPATAAAVPFLYELLNGVDIKGKSDIAGLLASIAAGKGYLEVHAVGKFAEKWRSILAKEGKSLDEEVAREEAQTLEVRRAASARLLDLVPYLRDPEPENRLAVAEALGCYPGHRATTLPALRSAAADETTEEVSEAIARSISRLDGGA
jgi:hypothetical protein